MNFFYYSILIINLNLLLKMHFKSEKNLFEQNHKYYGIINKIENKKTDKNYNFYINSENNIIKKFPFKIFDDINKKNQFKNKILDLKYDLKNSTSSNNYKTTFTSNNYTYDSNNNNNKINNLKTKKNSFLLKNEFKDKINFIVFKQQKLREMKHLLNKEYEKPIYNINEIYKKRKKFKQIVLTPHTSKKNYFNNSSKSSNKLTSTKFNNLNNLNVFNLDNNKNSRNFNKAESLKISLQLIGIGGSFQKNNNIFNTKERTNNFNYNFI